MESSSTGTHQRKFRKNGLQWPFHPLQVVSWVLFSCLGVGTFGAKTLVLPSIWAIITFSIVFGLLLLLIFTLGLVVTLSDSRDPLTFQNLRESILGNKENETLFCKICNSKVADKTKHCRTCNKCIANFDHHCIWLNNCIGARNYTNFFLLLTITLGYSLLDVLLSVFCIVDYFVNIGGGQTIQQRVEILYKVKGHPSIILIILFILLSLQCFVSVTLLQLFSFHLKLRFILHKTTYEYILDLRKQENKNENTTTRRNRIKTLFPCLCNCHKQRVAPQNDISIQTQ